MRSMSKNRTVYAARLSSDQAPLQALPSPFPKVLQCQRKGLLYTHRRRPTAQRRQTLPGEVWLWRLRHRVIFGLSTSCVADLITGIPSCSFQNQPNLQSHSQRSCLRQVFVLLCFHLLRPLSSPPPEHQDREERREGHRPGGLVTKGSLRRSARWSSPSRTGGDGRIGDVWSILGPASQPEGLDLIWVRILGVEFQLLPAKSVDPLRGHSWDRSLAMALIPHLYQNTHHVTMPCGFRSRTFDRASARGRALSFATFSPQMHKFKRKKMPKKRPRIRSHSPPVRQPSLRRFLFFLQRRQKSRSARGKQLLNERFASNELLPDRSRVGSDFSS